MTTPRPEVRLEIQSARSAILTTLQTSAHANIGHTRQAQTQTCLQPSPHGEATHSATGVRETATTMIRMTSTRAETTAAVTTAAT